MGSWLYPTTVPAPVYPDYGMTVIYEDNTVYVDNKPMPVEQYTGPIVEIAATQEQAPPPAPETRREPARETLPQTASPLALLLLGGVASTSLGLRLLRKSS